MYSFTSCFSAYFQELAPGFRISAGGWRYRWQPGISKASIDQGWLIAPELRPLKQRRFFRNPPDIRLRESADCSWPGQGDRWIYAPTLAHRDSVRPAAIRMLGEAVILIYIDPILLTSLC